MRKAPVIALVGIDEDDTCDGCGETGRRGVCFMTKEPRRVLCEECVREAAIAVTLIVRRRPMLFSSMQKRWARRRRRRSGTEVQANDRGGSNVFTSREYPSLIKPKGDG